MVTSEAVFSPQNLWMPSFGARVWERGQWREAQEVNGLGALRLDSAQRCVLFYLLCFGLVWAIFPCPRVWADYKATSNSPGQIETEAEDRSSPFMETKHGAGERGRKSDAQPSQKQSYIAYKKLLPPRNETLRHLMCMYNLAM